MSLALDGKVPRGGSCKAASISENIWMELGTNQQAYSTENIYTLYTKTRFFTRKVLDPH